MNFGKLFASPSLRVPGILQSNFMSRVGGSQHVRSGIIQAFADGHGVTAKIRWISPRARGSSSSDGAAGTGKGRWIHCTPLLGSNGSVGVWMVVLVDDEKEEPIRSVRDAPPVNVRAGPRARPGGSVFDGNHDDNDGGDDQMSLSSVAATVQRGQDEHRQVLGPDLRHAPSDLRSVSSSTVTRLGRSSRHGLRALFSKHNHHGVDKSTGALMVETAGMTDDV